MAFFLVETLVASIRVQLDHSSEPYCILTFVGRDLHLKF